MTDAKNVIIAVLGATGELGRTVLQALSDRDVPAQHVRAVASQRSLGSIVGYGDGDDDLRVDAAETFDYTSVDVVISALSPEVAQQLLPGIARTGTRVIDTSAAFRMDPDVPLLVPGVNGDALQNARKNIIACPDAVSSLLASVLYPIHEQAVVKRAVVSTYQSTATAGRAAMDELFNQTRAVYVNDNLIKEQFAKQIAFNAIPQIGNFREDGQTDGEFRLISETKRLLDGKVKVAATSVRIAAFLGTGMAVNVECEQEIDTASVRNMLRRHAGISVVDHRHEEGYVTLVETAGEPTIYISRVRDDTTVDNGVSFWVAADETRVGLAHNAVNIALAWVGAAQATRH